MKNKIYLIRSGKTNFGGAENYLLRLKNVLETREIEHEIITSPLPNFLPSWVRALLFNVYLIFIKKNKFFYSLDRITCPDLYRAGDGVHKTFLSIEKKSRLNLLHPTYIYLEKRCFKNAKSIITNSKMVKDEIIQTYKINPKKINVIYNGIELKTMNNFESFEKLSKEFPIYKKHQIILFVGSGFKRKGVEQFLGIFAKIKNRDLIAFIIGKESNMNFYHKLAKKLKIDSKVFFTGPRIDVDDFYTISDILLFPTHYDPFSNVVLEAMNFGNVVFTTCNNGAKEILDKNFIMESPFDLSVISKIEFLLGNKVALNKEKETNKKISQQFSIEKNLEKTLEIINKIEY